MKGEEMEIKHNVVGWFEIPVSDMKRAIKFYETVLGVEISRNQMGPLDMGWFPWIDGTIGAGGSLVYYPDYYKPSANGSMVYFTAFSGDLANELGKVEAAGGSILQPKREIAPGYGFMAVVIDTEGNKIALHSKE